MTFEHVDSSQFIVKTTWASLVSSAFIKSGGLISNKGTRIIVAFKLSNSLKHLRITAPKATEDWDSPKV